MSLKDSVFEELKWRGMIHQITHPELPEILAKEKLTLYCGFDPTSDSLHIGSLLPIMGLVHFQRYGHQPIVLVGGGTGLIGDPSGKKDERQLLSKEDVERNAQLIKEQLAHFISFEGENRAIMVNNADWLCELRLTDFLRDIGKHFSVNVMLNKEAIKQRLEDREHGISYTEFSYCLLQSYDYLHLCKNYNCKLQVGGSDQWGNIVSGIDLTRKLLGVETYGLTFPLVTKSDGSKFGKTESGNIWLDPKKTTPYRFYQFWVNQADADTPKYLRYFTLLSEKDIFELEEQLKTEPHKRTAQKTLAREITKIVHGETALQSAIKASEAMFGGDLKDLDISVLEDVFSDVPNYEFPKDVVGKELQLLDLLVKAGFIQSKGEGKRLVKNGGLYINNERVEDELLKLSGNMLLSGKLLIIRIGKKDYKLIRFT
ncbi:MAG: tyrosine--tRNA ligase [Candidatus Hydrogenedentes bacterium]|nr:tyrosine--tRNA ligase [Candidatus Hydrogenedentota bacterium]